MSSSSSSEVKIIQMWDGYRPKINLLLGIFYACLVDQNLTDITRQKQELENKEKFYHRHHQKLNSRSILWIEKILQTPISDHRKFASHWILSRYLINVKHQTSDVAYAVVMDWLLKCNEVERLPPSIRDFDKRIRNDIKEAIKCGKVPIGKNLLIEMNKELYEISFL